MSRAVTPRRLEQAREKVECGYVEWRQACLEVRRAYDAWTSAPEDARDVGHAAFSAALEREEASASAYRTLLLRYGGG